MKMVDRRSSWSTRMADRIPDLPDELLIRILSLLPVEAIARAKLVSKAWKIVSEFSFVPPLTFQCPPHPHPRPKVIFPISFLFKSTDTKCHSSFIDLIDSSLKLHYQKNLSFSKLRLRLDLYRTKSHSFIDSWIDAALERKVGHLDLSFLHNSKFNYYPFLAKVFSARSITVLCLEDFNLEIHGNANIDLPALRKLRLRHIQINQQSLQKLISSCPSIRDLEISNCSSLQKLHVSGLAYLQRFSVIWCFGLGRIEIDVPSLQYISHHHGPSPCVVVLNSGEFLRELILWNSYITEDLFQYLVSGIPNLERLEINRTRMQRIQILHHWLKRLDITLTDKQKNAIFKIDTPNLRSLKYNGYRMPFNSIMSSLNTSSLEETEINIIRL